MPVRQVAVDERVQRPLLAEECLAMRIEFCRRGEEGLFHQFVLGLEVCVEPAMGQVQRLHQGLQAGGANAIAAKAHGRFLDDALVSLGFVVSGITHKAASGTRGKFNQVERYYASAHRPAGWHEK